MVLRRSSGGITSPNLSTCRPRPSWPTLADGHRSGSAAMTSGPGRSRRRRRGPRRGSCRLRSPRFEPCFGHRRRPRRLRGVAHVARSQPRRRWRYDVSLTVDRHYAGCSQRPFAGLPGCDRCGGELTGRRLRWCSRDCADADLRDHYWGAARRQALERDGRCCVRCGNCEGLEVNHKTPRVGAGYLMGCWNHPDGLETLCRPHHQEVTNQQRLSRKLVSP